MHWSGIFFFPAAQLFVLAVLLYFFMHDTPEEAGFDFNIGSGDEIYEKVKPKDERIDAPPPSLLELFKTVFINPVISSISFKFILFFLFSFTN